MIPHCAVCRWVGAAHLGLDSRLARCLRPTSLRHHLSSSPVAARSWGSSEDIYGELGQHWEPRDHGEPVETAVNVPRGGSDGAEAEPA